MTGFAVWRFDARIVLVEVDELLGASSLISVLANAESRSLTEAGDWSMV